MTVGEAFYEYNRRHAEAQRERDEAARRALCEMMEATERARRRDAPPMPRGPGWTSFDQILFARYCKFLEAP